MKLRSLTIILILLMHSYFSFAQEGDERQLWLITARISHNTTYQRDTVSSFMAGPMKWEKEFHQSARSEASGTITAVVENQAENPTKDFLYHSDAGDPVSFSVTGNGSSSESSNSQETIGGKLTSADIRNDNVSGSAREGATLYFEFSDESKTLGITLDIKAIGSYKGRMWDGEWKDYGGDYDDYNINCSGGGDALTDNSCKMTKTGKGYQGSWRESVSEKHQTSNGPEYRTSETTVEITVMPYKESDKPVVTIDGCKDLGTGETGTVTATAKPEGGSFKFWVEPADLMTVSASGATATLTGQKPGRGVLMVEYTTSDGKTAQSSAEASCVKIESYNGGQSIPQIALFDIDGKKKSGIVTVPVKGQPENATELVKFEPADPGVLSAVGVGNEVSLQGIRTGKTTLQAKTNCGEDTGPAVEVEVVNCDDETIATLERMMAAAKEGQKDAYKAIEEIVGTKEFEELENKIAESTGNLAVKTAGLIVGTLSGAKGVDAGVKTAGELFGRASNVIDILKGENIEAHISNYSQLIVELAGGPFQQAIAGSIETLQAAKDFGTDLGKMIGSSRQLQSAMKEAEHWNKVVEDIVAKQKFCRKSKEQPQQKQQPPTEPKPEPTEPTAQTPKPPVQPPTEPASPVNTPIEEPTVPDEPTDDGTEISPPSPTSPPRQVGLPYSPSECGCNQTDSLAVSSKGFSTLQTGIENLGECVDNFGQGPLTNYIQTLQDWQTVFNKLQEATKAKPAEFKLVAEQSIPKMEALLGQTHSFDIAGKTFLKEFEKCPESVSTGMEVLKSAETVTIDSIKTHY